MAKYVVSGGAKLVGDIKISGNKNEILPCMAATLLTDQPVTLTNVPQISDVEVFKELLKSLGSVIEEGDHSLTIQTSKISQTSLPNELTDKLRASALLVGPLLAIRGKAEFEHPGGDVIGKRSLDSHFDGFRKMGFKVEINDKWYKIHGGFSKPREVEIFMEETSITAAENLLLLAVLLDCKTTIKNFPEEPHVVDLGRMLIQMGAKIEGLGTSKVVITGVKKLTGTEFKIGLEHIEVGTYAVAAAITKGKIRLLDVDLNGLEPIIVSLSRMGVVFKKEGKDVVVSADNLVSIPSLKTNVWPGFPTDLMSVMVVLATQSKGVSLLHDWMYESRMFFVDKLISMGAHITIADPHRVLVYGPTKLNARLLETPDIRAGISLVLAAIVANGVSTINRAELIERGYEDVVGNLNRLGAQIERIE